VVNAAGMGAGFTIALLILGAIREILGAGSLFGVNLFGASFEPWVVMILPPGGFIVLSLMLVVFNVINKRLSNDIKQAKGCSHES